MVDATIDNMGQLNLNYLTVLQEFLDGITQENWAPPFTYFAVNLAEEIIANHKKMTDLQRKMYNLMYFRSVGLIPIAEFFSLEAAQQRQVNPYYRNYLKSAKRAAQIS